jgi:hypothetical protein
MTQSLHMKVTGLQDMAPCGLVEAGRLIRGAYCLRHHVPMTEAVLTSER